MVISAFITIGAAGDLSGKCIESAREFADEIIVVNGSPKPKGGPSFYMAKGVKHKLIYHEWPKEFSWPFIGQQFQRGYEAASGDWVIHLDADFIFHQRDYGKIRQAMRDYPSAPAVSFYKWQFILPHKYNLKSRLVLAVNKKVFGDRIKFNGGGDLCQPTLDGRDLSLNEVPQAGVPFYNYEKLIKTQAQIQDDVGRMDRAYQRHFGQWLYSEDGSDESAYEGWYRMMAGRFDKPSEKIPLSSHPEFMQSTIYNLTPEQFGYNGFGLIEGKSYA